jgi:hypothetical protein
MAMDGRQPFDRLRAMSESNGPEDDDITTFVMFCRGLSIYYLDPRIGLKKLRDNEILRGFRNLFFG